MSTPQPPSRRASTASKPMSRLGCALGSLAWLFVMTVPLLGFMLAVRGEFTWRRNEFVEDRLWLITAESTSGDERVVRPARRRRPDLRAHARELSALARAERAPGVLRLLYPLGQRGLRAERELPVSRRPSITDLQALANP